MSKSWFGARGYQPTMSDLKMAAAFARSGYTWFNKPRTSSNGRARKPRWGSASRQGYVVKCRKVKCKPMSPCLKKDVKGLIRHQINRNTEIKYKERVFVTSDMVNGADATAVALQVYSLANLIGTGNHVIQRISASETADLNGKRKGRAINLVRLQIRLEVKSSEELQRCKFFLYVLKSKTAAKPNVVNLQPSTFLDNQSIWRSTHMKERFVSTLYKSSITIKTPLQRIDTFSSHVTRVVPYPRRRVINVNLKNMLCETDGELDATTQNFNIHFVIFAEYEKADGTHATAFKKPSIVAKSYLWYRDG